MQNRWFGLALGVWFVFGVPAAAPAAERNAALHSITGSEIQRHIEILADDAMEGREAGTRGGMAAARYLVTRLRGLGLEPAGVGGRYRQPFHGGYHNVLAVIRGDDPRLENEYVLVGAHYDHVGYGTRKTSLGPVGYVHNGADDNASGVAGVLEVIDAFVTLGVAPRRSLLFAFWDGEEKGLLGSKHWAVHPTIPLDRVVFTIHADMIGRLRDQELKVYGTRTSRGLRRLIALENRGTELRLDFRWEMKANSDHSTFFDRDIPVVLFHTGLHRDFHRPSDDPDKINAQGAQQVARLMFLVIFELANRPVVHGFRSRSRAEGAADRRALERPLAPRPPRLGVVWERRRGERSSVWLTRVLPGSPAARADLRPGDELVRFNGEAFGSDDELRAAILAAPSQSVVTVQRGQAEPLEIPVQLEGKPLRLGISWREDPAEPGTLVLSQVVPGSPAAACGLKVADRIYELDGRRFRDGNEFMTRLAAVGDSTELLVERWGRLRTVAVRLRRLESAEVSARPGPALPTVAENAD